MKNDEFEPHRLKRAKLYLDATIDEVRQNYLQKGSIFQNIKTFFKRILKK